ncbi:MAG: inositol monophosphatase [Gammaproteobacteria bacterium RBG_16_57_12]|nr:MAG: inositol monophosphatase [Gammaproteobacteria bacterium RBG_16_57_12]
MNPMLNIAIRAARRAGSIITRNIDFIDRLDVSAKSQNDFVSDVDRQAEEEIIAVLRKAFPSHGILAEESGASQGDDYLWIIDPLDGTTNFLHGFPQFSVSIALQCKGRLELGVVYDPLRQELFTAERGAGAKLNDRRIRVSKLRGLDGALLGTGFPFKHHQHLDAYLATFKALSPMTSGIRRAGSAALDLAYVAAGRLDGFWAIGLSPWDMAAGVILIREAGGLAGDFAAGDDFMDTGNLIAGNPKVYHAIYQTIKPHLGPALAK